MSVDMNFERRQALEKLAGQSEDFEIVELTAAELAYLLDCTSRYLWENIGPSLMESHDKLQKKTERWI